MPRQGRAGRWRLDRRCWCAPSVGRHGLALAMLHAVFGEFYRSGVYEVELSVDAGSPSGAPRLYTRAGMEVSQSISLYRRRLRPGRDYSTLPESAGER